MPRFRKSFPPRNASVALPNCVISLFHAKVCLVAGVGFFTDAYDIFAINIASTMLGYVYNDGTSGLTTLQFRINN